MRARSAVVFLFSAILAAGAASQSSLYYSIDSSVSCDIDRQAFRAESQVTLGKSLDARSRAYIEGGNWLGFDGEWSDELSIGARCSIFEWLAASLHAVFVAAPDLDLYLRPALGIALEFDDAGISLSDENEACLFFLDGEIEYANTLDCDISFDIARRSFLILGASNELGWAGELSEAAKARVGFEARGFSLALSYGLGILPETSHSIGLDASYEFGGSAPRPIFR